MLFKIKEFFYQFFTFGFLQGVFLSRTHRMPSRQQAQEQQQSQWV